MKTSSISAGNSTVARGRRAEAFAVEHYIKNGCEILARNYSVRGGEIDFIARDGNETAFVEVKMRTSLRFGEPAEAITLAKRRRICRAALMYAQANGLLDATLRFDVCEVLPGEIRVYKNAFDYVSPE